MSAIRVVESSGSLGALQISDGSGGFLSGSLIAGSNVTIADDGSGNFTFSTSGGGAGSITVNSGSTDISSVSTIAASDGFLLVNEGSGRAALTASIGLAEDGDYTDGLFIDFTPQTRLGIAIDRFNEILKALAPSPAPPLDDIDTSDSGTNNAYLSFGASNDLTSGSPAYVTVGSGAGIGNTKDVNEQYIITTSGNNKRIGLFNGTTTINGILNDDITSNSQGGGYVNYPADSFGNADQGDIKLEVNGVILVTASMTDPAVGAGSSGAGTDDSNVNANGSGFLNLSEATNGTFSNGNTFSTFKHRTGEYTVDPDDQRNGWNYARVIHTIGSTDTVTNYIEWVNDNDATSTTFAGNSLEFNGSTTIHLSGIEYFTAGTATYKSRVANNYLYVHDRDDIDFPTSTGGSLNSGASFSLSSQSKPAIDTGTGEDHTKVLHLTASNSVSANYMLDGSLTAGTTITHPLKSISANQGQATTTGILFYNLSNNSTNQQETFRRENFRIISGSYDTQASLTDVGNVWDSTKHLTASNGDHTNGLQFYNQRLYSPTNTLNSGDFRNTSDGGSLDNGPDENPDYSGETGQRTFYRWFRNETGSTQYDLTINIQGSSTTIVPVSTSLTSGNIRVFVKFPNNGSRETGWLDLATEFVLDSYDDNDGALTTNGSLSFDNSLNATNYVTLGTVGILDDEYIGLRIEADSSWTGYISQITVTFGVGTGTPATYVDLNEIDCDDDGTDCNLSFGNSKSIGGYENPATTYQPDGDSAFTPLADLNSLYQTATSGNNLRRSVFKFNTIIEGDINPDDSFFFADANSGSLVLEVNGDELHRVDLTGAYNNVGSGEPGSGIGTGTSFTGNSGFFQLSVWRPAEYDNDVPYYLEIRRSGKYRIHTDDQRDGWNYARILHSGSWGVRTTNHVEWVNDSESQNNNLSSAGVGITDFGDDTFAYSSGVKFFTSPSGSIESRISNIYKNVYSDSSSAISFINLSNATGAKIIQQGDGLSSTKETSSSTDSLQTLNTNSDSQNEVLHVTGTINFTPSKSLLGDFTTAYNCAGGMRFLHPFKTTLDLATQTATNLLVWTPTNTSNTNYNEYFTDETYRIVSGSYDTQSSVTDVGNDWDSEISINDTVTYPEYATGLLVYDTYIMSPYKAGVSGDFTDSSITGPSGNVDYSSLTETTREYYRGFLNPTTNDLARITIVLYGDATIVGKSTSLGTNKNIHIELKIPEKTGFLDLGTASPGSGNVSDGDGCLFGDPDATVDGDGATNVCTFNGVTVDGTTSGAEYFVIKISASENWTGYVDRIQVTWSG